MFASALAFLCLCASASTFAPQPCMSRSGVCSGALSPCLPAGAISAARPSAATMRMQDSGEKQELSRERRALLQVPSYPVLSPCKLELTTYAWSMADRRSGSAAPVGRTSAATAGRS